MKNSQRNISTGRRLAIACLALATSNFVVLICSSSLLSNQTAKALIASPDYSQLQQLIVIALVFVMATIGCSVVLLGVIRRTDRNTLDRAKKLRSLKSILSPKKSTQELEGTDSGGTDSEDPGSKDYIETLERAAANLQIELTESRKMARAVIEKAVDVICIIDVNAQFVSVSPACESAWGYTPAELEGQSILNVMKSSETDAILHQILGAAKSIARVVIECQLEKKNGDLSEIIWTGYWSVSDGGLFSIMHDITDRKRAEEQVKANEERLALTLERLPAGVLLFSPKQRVEFANTEAANLYRLSRTELESATLANLFQSEPHFSSELGSQRAVAKRHDGSVFPVEISLNKIQINGEDKQLAVFVDKTEQQEIERLKGEFMAMIIHDIRSPLNSVSCMLDLLDLDAADEKQKRALAIRKNANQSISQIVRLINDLIDLERINSGKFELECTDIKIEEAINQAVESIQPTIEGKSLKFQTHLDEDSWCWGDHERLVQVILNLLTNACKYAPENSTINISTECSVQTLRVTISDTGPGIPADRLSKVFEKFEHADISDATKKGGKGLGLAICKAIVEEHGGTIGVESELGKLTSFWFRIPREAQDINP